MMNDQLLVFFPESRDYGWGHAYPPDPVLVVGRVFYASSLTPDEHRQLLLRVVEGSGIVKAVIDFCIPLQTLPAADKPFRFVELTSLDELNVGDRSYAMFFRKPPDQRHKEDPFRIPQLSLAAKGIIVGQRYPVEEWLFDNRAVRLSGIDGVYSAGMFVEA